MRFSRPLFLTLIVLLTAVGAAQAQKRAVRAKAPTQSTQVEQKDSLQDFRKAFIASSQEYQASLQKLLGLYENEVTKQTEQSNKLKQLYADGLISRQDYEASAGDITKAQVKVDEVRKELKSTEVAIAEAMRPPRPDELGGFNMIQMAGNAPPWTTGSARIDALIRQNGGRYGVDPYFIYCVIHQESSFNSVAVSVKGAQGLMQLMPGTAARYGVMNVNDPAQNIMGGTRYLRDLLQLFHGRIDLALAGYNAGEGAVIKYGQTIPPYKETRDYVRLITKRYLKRPATPQKTSQSKEQSTVNPE